MYTTTEPAVVPPIFLWPWRMVLGFPHSMTSGPEICAQNSNQHYTLDLFARTLTSTRGQRSRPVSSGQTGSLAISSHQSEVVHAKVLHYRAHSSTLKLTSPIGRSAGIGALLDYFCSYKEQQKRANSTPALDAFMLHVSYLCTLG